MTFFVFKKERKEEKERKKSLNIELELPFI